MKSAALHMAALCVCPPAILATSVATVPSVKRAVHHATRPAPTKHMLARAKKPVQTAAAKTAPCDATPAIRTSSVLPYAIPLPQVDTTDAGTGNIPGSPLLNGGSAGGGTGVVPVGGTPLIFGGGGGGTGGSSGGDTTPSDPTVTPTDPTTPTTPVTPTDPVAPVPEPATWLLMISGFALVGAGLRYRRRAPVPAGVAIADASALKTSSHRRRRVKKAGRWSSVMTALGFGEATAGSASMATVAAKAMMCVCPTAAIVGTTMAVPPVRSAVYKATAVPVRAPKYVATVKPPCDPTLRSAAADAPPSRILDAADASPKMQTALLASTSTSTGGF